MKIKIKGIEEKVVEEEDEEKQVKTKAKSRRR